MSYVFDPVRLQQLSAMQADTYRSATPYPHAVIDDFLRPECAKELSTCFPRPEDDIGWDYFGAEHFEVKMGCSHEQRFPQALRSALHDLNSGPFVDFLEKLTGIGHLLPDPHMVGGGIHLTRQGGHLGIHADFNWHERLQAHRRLNVLIYLTPDWTSALGGELELWDRQAKACQRIVEPLFNRAVIFSTRSDSFHGHPNHWKSATVHRQSIALYYYTAQAEAGAAVRPPHSTLYKGLHLD
ncbi:2OG-Fe(II) oxygenase [Dokdonella immobilis]|uniref:2OG-Fe(II) oxygenase superfamily protein n=1 Tax=Dokdonella immobilis TaxID=578942 RepID=A0A1I4ZRI0_9GAMM|nr:2OG-Fe(II) oxygenase [Dokdonella immobilis]SFN52885.1 2OG-Fe(II) oxygenase superfamily protein [Dokdonella immobilis]